MKPTNTAVAYVRVSTKRQDAEGILAPKPCLTSIDSLIHNKMGWAFFCSGEEKTI